MDIRTNEEIAADRRDETWASNETMFPSGSGWWHRDVLDHGFVELIHWGPTQLDLAFANAARVSRLARKEEMDDASVGLVRRLMEDHHGTPFEHGLFTFRVKLPIFVEREWVRHRTASTSEWSARYSQLKPEFYVPAVEDMRKQVGKSMSYTYEAMDPLEADGFRARMKFSNQSAFDAYHEMLDAGVAKEVARTVLPVSTYTEKQWSVNPRNLLGFLTLRNAPQAQLEIRRYADAIESIVDHCMPVTMDAYRQFGREKP